MAIADLIEQHRVAWDAIGECPDVADDAPVMAAWNERNVCAYAIWERIVASEPATPAEAALLARYVASQETVAHGASSDDPACVLLSVAGMLDRVSDVPAPIISLDALGDVLAASTEAQAYVLHPASITPCATKRVATHRVPRHEFDALANQLRTATKAVGDVLRSSTPR